jgi:hypothetical protein
MAFALLTLVALAAGAPPAPPVQAEPTVATRSLDKMVCKRMKRTGSLVATSRLCMTRREWIRSAETNQNEWGQLQGVQGSSREDQPTFTYGTPPPQ